MPVGCCGAAERAAPRRSWRGGGACPPRISCGCCGACSGYEVRGHHAEQTRLVDLRPTASVLNVPMNAARVAAPRKSGMAMTPLPPWPVSSIRIRFCATATIAASDKPETESVFFVITVTGTKIRLWPTSRSYCAGSGGNGLDIRIARCADWSAAKFPLGPSDTDVPYAPFRKISNVTTTGLRTVRSSSCDRQLRATLSRINCS